LPYFGVNLSVNPAAVQWKMVSEDAGVADRLRHSWNREERDRSIKLRPPVKSDEAPQQ